MSYVFRVLVFALAPTIAGAAPGEDHWTVAMDPAHADALVQSKQLIASDQYCEALPILEELQKAIPANADVFNMLGYVQRKMGDLDLSGAHYRHALYLKPDHRAALAYQGELFLAQDNPDAALANLARLENLCSSGCDERDELALAIRAWQDTRN